jgi:organic radical activating enzyme
MTQAHTSRKQINEGSSAPDHHYDLIGIARAFGLDPSLLIDQIRARALRSGLSEQTRHICQRNAISVPMVNTAALPQDILPFIDHAAQRWMSDHKFHLRNRLRGDNPAHFSWLTQHFPPYKRQNPAALEAYFKTQYDLSALPIHLSPSCQDGLRYFLPPLHFMSKPDPYGIKHSKSAILDKNAKHDGHFYVASRHPNYATYLFTLTVPSSFDPTKGTFLCPVGCFSCYRGAETRNKKNIAVSDTGEALLASKIRQQTDALIAQWDTGVNDILISGGEPLLFSNALLKAQILDPLQQALRDQTSPVQALKSLRLCTGALGLGLFSRFDDALLDMFADFRKQTGVQISINAHIAHPDHFTPEVIEVAQRIKSRGIRIMPQIPLIHGINFFNDQPEKTQALLARLADLSFFGLGDPVYKFIIDMQGSVSLLQALHAQRVLFETHQGRSNIVRPVSFELFVEHGASHNLNLSAEMLKTLKARYTDSTVDYTLPHPAGGHVLWQEALTPQVNDRNAFKAICRY